MFSGAGLRGGAELHQDDADYEVGSVGSGIDAFLVPGDLDGDGAPEFGARTNEFSSPYEHRAFFARGADIPGGVADLAAPWAELHYAGMYSTYGEGDLDGDGLGDITFADEGECGGHAGLGCMYVLMGSTLAVDGTFTTSDVDDIDGDGLADLVVSGEAGICLSVPLPTAGLGSVLDAATLVVVTDASPSWNYYLHSVTDLDGDGRADPQLTVVEDDGGYLVAFLASTLPVGAVEPDDANLHIRGALEESYYTAPFFTRMDFDADGMGDLVMGERSTNSVLVMPSSGLPW